MIADRYVLALEEMREAVRQHLYMMYESNEGRKIVNTVLSVTRDAEDIVVEDMHKSVKCDIINDIELGWRVVNNTDVYCIACRTPLITYAILIKDNMCILKKDYKDVLGKYYDLEEAQQAARKHLQEAIIETLGIKLQDYERD